MPTFEEKINEYREEIDNYLNSKLPSGDIPPKNLHQAMNYSVMNGGKRIRAFLVSESSTTLPLKSLVDVAITVSPLAAFS